MRLSALSLFLLLPGLLAAQHRRSAPLVRSISVNVVSTSPAGLPTIGFDAVTAAWKRRQQVDLAVEKPLDPASLDKAGQVISDLYGARGHAVRVEHSLHSIPPRALEVTFQVIELCPSKPPE